jgi:gamma-glutamyltranspeptidase/glutathione hydrolase
MTLRDGRPWLVFGCMGGDAQAQVHPQVLTRRVDGHIDLQAAIHAPRWRVEPEDWTLRTEDRFAPEIGDGLRRRGHDPRRAPPFDAGMGHAHGIELTAHGFAVAVDPRSEGAAAGA